MLSKSKALPSVVTVEHKNADCMSTGFSLNLLFVCNRKARYNYQFFKKQDCWVFLVEGQGKRINQGQIGSQ